MSFEWMPLVIIALALVLLGAGGWILMSRQWLGQWLMGTGGLLLVIMAVYMSFLAVNLYEYDEIGGGEPLATLNFRETGEQQFIATVGYRDGRSRDYPLEGDLWHMDVRMLEWQGFFALLGARPGFQLESLRGRFLSLEDERSREQLAHRLHEPGVGMDVWEWAYQGRTMMLDARRDQVRFLPMADGAIFEVTMTPTGLTGRPLNGIAEQALARWD